MSEHPSAAVGLTICFPLYQEEAAAPRAIAEWLAVLPPACEVLLVDDGCTDGTVAAIAPLLADERVRVIRHPINRGYGACIKTALAAARGEWLLTVDGDGTYPAESLPPMLAQMEGADMVIGARSHEPDPIKAVPKTILRQSAALFAGTPIPDLNTGLRIVRVDVLRRYVHLLPEGFSACTTMTLAPLVGGDVVRFVTVPYRTRAGGKSKFHPLFDTSRMAWRIVRTWALVRLAKKPQR